jgi:uncharacterized protein involved in response to NO
MVQQGFLLSLVMGVGGFLGSRLMGIYELPNPEMFQKALSRRKYRLGAHLACGAILFLSFWFETWGSILRAVIVTISLGVMSQVLRRPKIHDLFRQLLSYSFWFVVLGVWFTALFPRHRIAILHLLFLGGFSLMTFLVSIMVVLSHSGNAAKLGQPLWIFWVIFIGLTASLIVRLLTQFVPEHYFIYLGVASSFWILTGIAWLFFSAPYLWRAPKESAGETC